MFFVLLTNESQELHMSNKIIIFRYIKYSLFDLSLVISIRYKIKS